MASIKDLGNGKYRVHLCSGRKADGTLNRTSKVITAKSDRDAEKQAQALEVDFKRGNQIQFSSAPSFTELVERWRELKKPEMEYKTQERYENFLCYFMLPYFGSMKVRDIRAINVEAYLNTLTKDGVRVDGKQGSYSEKTIHDHYMFIQTLLNYAVKWDMIEYNPCIKVDTPKVHQAEAKYYEDDNIKRLLDCLEEECEKTKSKFSVAYSRMDPEEAYRRQQVRIFSDLMHKTYVWVALASACRRSELVGLMIDGIDFNNNLIAIRQVGHYMPDYGIYTADHLKNHSVSKYVDMPLSVMQQLKLYLNVRQQLFDLMGWEDSGYVFVSLKEGAVTTGGGPMMPDVISRWFTRFLKKYNLPKITLHQVRHTSISYLINQKVDVKKIADRAGHKNTRTTEEIYGHVFAKTKRATADEYDSLFTPHMCGEK